MEFSVHTRVGPRAGGGSVERRQSGRGTNVGRDRNRSKDAQIRGSLGCGAQSRRVLDQAIAGAATALRVRAGSALLVAQDPLTLGGKDRLARCMASENSWKPAACCPMPPT
jgi:hypothetical protein